MSLEIATIEGAATRRNRAENNQPTIEETEHAFLVNDLLNVEVFKADELQRIKETLEAWERGQPPTVEEIKYIVQEFDGTNLLSQKHFVQMCQKQGRRFNHDMDALGAGLHSAIEMLRTDVQDNLINEETKQNLSIYYNTLGWYLPIIETLAVEQVESQEPPEHERFVPYLEGEDFARGLQWAVGRYKAMHQDYLQRKAQGNKPNPDIHLSGDLEKLSNQELRVRGGDFVRLVINFLSNAWKRSGADNILVRVQTMEDELILTVADDGTGMPANYINPEHQGFVFKYGTTHHEGGTGQGLPDSESVASMGAVVAVETRMPGEEPSFYSTNTQAVVREDLETYFSPAGVRELGKKPVATVFEVRVPLQPKRSTEETIHAAVAWAKAA